jgi:hypothetical protein
MVLLKNFPTVLSPYTYGGRISNPEYIMFA